MRLERRGSLFATFSLGNLTVTALSDGNADMETSCLKGQNGAPAPLAVLSEAGLSGGRLRLQVNAFLIEAPDGNLLIDAGCSNAWRPTTGRIYDALDEARVSRSAIRSIAITHTHIDHISGLVMPDGTSTFPSAEAIFVPENETALFAAESRLEIVAGLVQPVKNGDMIGKHVTVEAAYGHEIGHSAFLVQSGRDRLLVWGDIVHEPSVQFAHPEVTWEFDADPSEATLTRARLLERTSREQLPVAGAHLAFPGIGHVRAAGEAFSFLPLI